MWYSIPCSDQSIQTISLPDDENYFQYTEWTWDSKLGAYWSCMKHSDESRWVHRLSPGCFDSGALVFISGDHIIPQALLATLNPQGLQQTYQLWIIISTTPLQDRSAPLISKPRNALCFYGGMNYLMWRMGIEEGTFHGRWPSHMRDIHQETFEDWSGW